MPIINGRWQNKYGRPTGKGWQNDKRNAGLRRLIRAQDALKGYRDYIMEHHSVSGLEPEGWFRAVPFLNMKVYGENPENAFLKCRDELLDRLATRLETFQGLPDLQQHKDLT
jgi:hypothetical protein